MTLSVCLVIPTWNAEGFFIRSPWLADIIKTTPTLIIDSSSCDATIDLASSLGADVLVIPQADFNHGATREWARKHIDTDIVVFLTQDAIPTSSNLVETLVEPLLCDESIAVSYSRQIPQDEADIFEAFPRIYNYGKEPQIRSIEDIAKYGVYTFFCSNSCAAWKNAALDAIGGFKSVLTNEDYFAVAELLQLGYKIAYVPEAVVKHSHKYTLWQEFQRYFDTGYVRAENPIIQQLVGHAESRGVGFMSKLIEYLWKHKPLLIPYAVLQSCVKWLGYRIGFFGKYLPLIIRRRLSQQVYYWMNQH